MSLPRWKPSRTVTLFCVCLRHLCSSVRLPEPEGGVWLWEHPDAFEDPADFPTAQAEVSLGQTGNAETVDQLGIPYGSDVSRPKEGAAENVLSANVANAGRGASYISNGKLVNEQASLVKGDNVPGVVTALAAIAGKGTTRIVVRDEFGFRVGDRIQIGEDSRGTPQIREIVGLNPILIERPLEKSFPPGTLVKTYKDPPPSTATTTTVAPVVVAAAEERNLTCVKPEEATMLIFAVIALGILTVVLLCVVLGAWFCGWGREAAQFNCRVISEKKVGVLSEPDITAGVIKYVESGTIFGASLCAEPSDGRTYFLLQDKSGWVPECSRKDPARPVVTAQYVKTGKLKSRPSLESDGDDGGGKTL
eukprot:TRINITY_DN19467_c0_g1_i2.p1 TRINITY_DN19467_c0_g1~~TRINITY_DN19467_c0_g1_i2.p1  ORF type:complete len:363 (+),score=52.59 TRINITY_DN19467_c0_g1_i2:74-1162(+)